MGKKEKREFSINETALRINVLKNTRGWIIPDDRPVALRCPELFKDGIVPRREQEEKPEPDEEGG